MPNLRRCYGAGYLHFITFSCYRRLQFLGSTRRRDLFLRVLEQERRRYRFVVFGYVPAELLTFRCILLRLSWPCKTVCLPPEVNCGQHRIVPPRDPGRG